MRRTYRSVRPAGSDKLPAIRPLALAPGELGVAVVGAKWFRRRRRIRLAWSVAGLMLGMLAIGLFAGYVAGVAQGALS